MHEVRVRGLGQQGLAEIDKWCMDHANGLWERLSVSWEGNAFEAVYGFDLEGDAVATSIRFNDLS